MKQSKDYIINLFSLTNKKHHFEYEIEDSFFENFEDSLVSNGKFHVEINMDKSERLIQCVFSIKGETELICDRSLDPFNYPIDKEDKIIFKYAESYEEVSEDLIHIPEDLQQLDLAQYIFELISIEIPMKKVHPRYAEEEDEEDDFLNESNAELVYTSSTTEDEEESESEQSSEDEIDPRWKGLMNLKTTNKK